MLATVHRRALLLTIALLSGLLLCAGGARAAGSPDISATISSQEVLHGRDVPVEVTAHNPTGQPYAYNLSYRVVLPNGVSWKGGSPAPTTTVAGPGAGQRTLIFRNVSDLSPNSTHRLSFTLDYDESVYDVGDTFPVTAQAFVNGDERYVPRFDAAGLPVGPSADSYTGFAGPVSGTTRIEALEIQKDEPSPEGEILRGVHDHQTVYTLRVENNDVRATDGVTVVDHLPAGLEFIGCGGPGTDNTSNAPTNPGTAQEYPGSGPIASAALAPCAAPLSVETVEVDPDGAGPLLRDVYTRVTWNVGTLAARERRELRYRAAIPIRENTLTWSGARPATTGAQAANLDNNSGSETRDEQELTNYATAAGRYDGVLVVDDETWLTRTAEDWRVLKSADTGVLVQNGITWWTLTLDTSEYRSVRDATVTDTLPSGLCPLGSRNFTSGNEPSDADCAPTGDQPTSPYLDADENADGTWTLTWDSSVMPALGQTDVSETLTIRFPTRTRTHYQLNFRDTTPILTRDRVENSVETEATAIVRCLPSGTPDCTTPGAEIDHDAGYGTGTRIPDASQAEQEAGSPSIDKRVAAGPGPSCVDPFTDSVPVYHPGDTVCWKLRIDFPGAVDTSPQVIGDFLPPGSRYVGGSDAAFGDNNVTASLVDRDPADDLLEWTITGLGGTVPRGGRVFERTIQTIVEPPAVVNGEVLGNLMKFSSTNTPGVTEPLRDQVDIRLVTPVMRLQKGVWRTQRAGVPVLGDFGPNADDRVIQAGDAVTYRVDVTNTGGQDAVDVEVWDVLPRQFGCLVPGVRDISHGGVCSDETLRSDRVKWTIPSIRAGETMTLTYTATIPADANPVDSFDNTAGVRRFEGVTNTGGRYPYTPASNIDPDNRDTANAPRADDPSNVRTNDATIAKTRTTSRTETGNAAANQATIGERITYTVTATIPAGTTLGGSAAIADVLDSTTRQLVDRASATATLDGGALPGGFALDTSGATPAVTFPADFVAPPGQPDRVLVLRFDVVVADVAGNSRTAGDLTNRATLRWTDPDEGARTRTSSTVTTQIVEPLLSQAKTDDRNPNRVVPGDIVRYTVTTTNGAGSPGRVSPAHEVSIVDVVPRGLTPIEDAPGNAPVADGATVPNTGGAVWNLAARTITKTGVTIQPGANHAFSYRVQVDDPAIGGAILRNTVTSRTASLPAPDPDGERRTTGTGYEARADDTIQIQGASVTKSVRPSSATVGEHVEYELLVTIPADISLYDVTVADVLPNAMAFDAYGAVSCVSGCAGFPAVQTYDPTTAGDGTTTLGWDLGDIVTPLDDPLVVRVLYTAHVRETTAGSATRVVVGARAVNTVTVGSNRSDRGAFDRTRRPTTFEDRSPEARATVTVVEPRVGIDKAVSVDGGAFVDGPATAQSDDALTYRLVIRNTGDAPAHDVVVDDMPDAELTGVTMMAPLPTGVTETKAWSAADRRISWLIREIPANDSVTLTYDARLVAASGLSDGQAIDNTAAVPSYWGVPRAEREDPRNSTVDYREYRDGGDDSTRVVLDFPTLTLTKTTGLAGFPETGPAEVGNAYPWRVVVRNTSATATASDVVVGDVLPPNWDYDRASATLTPGGASEPSVTADAAGDRLAWTVASIAPGATVTIDYRATPAAEAADDPGLGPQANVNTARVTAARDEAGNTGNAGGDYVAGPDTATATLSVPQLRITKTPDGGSAVAGTASSFTVRVENIGAVDATDLVIEDVLPDGLTYQAGRATALPATGFAETSATAGPGAGQTTVVWTVTLLRAGETVSISVPVGVEAGVPEGATLENVASVRSAEAPTPIRDRGSLLVDARADMAIEKDGPARYVAGEGYTWRLRVRNLGPSDAQGVVVSDPLPAGTRFVSADAPCAFAAGEVRCAIGTARAGFDRTYEVTVDVEPGTDADPLVNEAAVTTTTEDTDPSNDRDDHRATPDPIADVTVVKTATPTAIARGGQTTFAIEVVNRGPSVARDVELSDPLPAGLDFVSADSGCTFAAGTVRCLLGDLAVDAPVTVNVTVRGTQNGAFRNVATVTTSTPQPPGGGEPDSDDATVEVGPVADLGIVKSGPATVLAGGQLTWDLAITNHGEDPATGVTVSDPLPHGVTFVSASDGCTVADGTVTCAVGALAVDETVTRQITVSVPHALGSATLVNTASVDGDQIDENPSNDRDDATTEVGPSTDLQVVKSGPATAAAGGQVAWTLVVTNNGPSAASGVIVADALPQGVAFVSATPAQGTCAPAGQLVSCALGALPSGGSTQVQVVGRLDVGEGTTVVNVATVSGEQPDPNPSNDRSEAPTRAGPPAEQPFDLAIAKRVADGARPAVGDRFAYELTVVNRGPGAARAVVVTDALPRQLRGLGANAQGGRCSLRKGVVGCALGDMAAGERRTVTVRVRAVAAGRAIRNTAIVSSSRADVDPSNDRAAATVRIDSGRAALQLSKRALRARASPGGVVRFRVTVRNASRNAAADVVVCDRLPEQLSLVKTGGGRLRGGDLCWTVGVLPAGRSRTFVVTTRVNRDARTGTVRNVAFATAENAARRTARAAVRIAAPGGAALPSFGRGGGVTG